MALGLPKYASKWHKLAGCRAQFQGIQPALLELVEPLGNILYKDIILVAFATVAGFTASGIFANLYRLLADKPETTGGRIGYIAVMIVAGPNVLFANAATSFRAKSCSSFAFWLATAISAYWSFALGLFMIQIGLAV